MTNSDPALGFGTARDSSSGDFDPARSSCSGAGRTARLRRGGAAAAWLQGGTVAAGRQRCCVGRRRRSLEFVGYSLYSSAPPPMGCLHHRLSFASSLPVFDFSATSLRAAATTSELPNHPILSLDFVWITLVLGSIASLQPSISCCGGRIPNLVPISVSVELAVFLSDP